MKDRLSGLIKEIQEAIGGFKSTSEAAGKEIVDRANETLRFLSDLQNEVNIKQAQVDELSSEMHRIEQEVSSAQAKIDKLAKEGDAELMRQKAQVEHIAILESARIDARSIAITKREGEAEKALSYAMQVKNEALDEKKRSEKVASELTAKLAEVDQERAKIKSREELVGVTEHRLRIAEGEILARKQETEDNLKKIAEREKELSRLDNHIKACLTSLDAKEKYLVVRESSVAELAKRITSRESGMDIREKEFQTKYKNLMDKERNLTAIKDDLELQLGNLRAEQEKIKSSKVKRVQISV